MPEPDDLAAAVERALMRMKGYEDAQSKPLAYRTEQALERFPVGRTTLYALAKAGRIQPVKVGRLTLWPESELVRLMAELTAEAADRSNVA